MQATFKKTVSVSAAVKHPNCEQNSQNTHTQTS